MTMGFIFCCQGAYISKEAIERKKQKTAVEQQTEPTTKSWDASVFPAKRKSVKKMACNSFIRCIFGDQCFKVKANEALPPTPSASASSATNCFCATPPQPLYAPPGNHGNKAKATYDMMHFESVK